jgi:hypothetical protein
LFDSHVHLLATGQVAAMLDLSKLGSIEDFGRLKASPGTLRGDWLVGFGWNESTWSHPKAPNRHDLDRFFPEQPVYFSRCDGHAAVTNSAGLKRLGLESQSADGLLVESLHYRALSELPVHTDEQLTDFLLKGAAIFNRAGFTHVRDMAGSWSQWEIACKLEKQERWNLHVDWNFTCENLRDFGRALQEANRARAEETRLNRVDGIKFYFDGSLGSETAFLSQPYANRTDGWRGQTFWSEAEVSEVMRQSWKAGFAVAVHTIGDEAVDQIVEIARKLSAAGVAGKLNLEHVQVLRHETMTKMKPLHIVCHLQPCHWLKDRVWLKKKLGTLSASAFPWEALRRAKIPFRFGSDSPIERPSLFDNLQALRESATDQIPALGEDPLRFHVHPNSEVIGISRFEGERAVEVSLEGRLVFSAND